MTLAMRSAFARVGKLRLAHLPTPLEHYPQLDALVGTEVWIKRDDATGGAEAGNKLRKLEYLLAEALQVGARAVVTCGGLQSNHARATAIAARRLGLQPILMLRSSDPNPGPATGNVLLDRLLGAEIQLITPAQYAQRDQLMAELAAARSEPTYVLTEGGSTGLGALGYVDAMAELRQQLDADPTLPQAFDAVVHACGSGGTAAGVQLGARHFGIAPEVIAMAVCDDLAYFEARIGGIVDDAAAYLAAPLPTAELRVVDAYKGPAYGVPSADQIAFIRAVAETCGILLDPVYSGKALFGLAQLPKKPRRALFVHTGGLPGLLAEAQRF